MNRFLVFRGRNLHDHLVASLLMRIAAKLVGWNVGKLQTLRRCSMKCLRETLLVILLSLEKLMKKVYSFDAFIVPSLFNLLGQEFEKMIHCTLLKCSFESDAFIVVSSLI